MASAIRAGDIRQLKINSREFDVKAGDATVGIVLNGFENDVSISGNGNLLVTQRRTAAKLDNLPLSIDDTNQDMEFLCAIRDAAQPVPVNMTLASGVTYAGTLIVQGEVKKNTGDGTATIELRGQNLQQI
jgi:hypothetical protein